MIECLISLIVVAIIALIVLLILEAVISAFVPLPGNITYLIRLLFALLVLLYGLQCVFGLGLVHFGVR